jgi:hypothetical protein
VLVALKNKPVRVYQRLAIMSMKTLLILRLTDTLARCSRCFPLSVNVNGAMQRLISN